jgi:hypothetical protein
MVFSKIANIELFYKKKFMMLKFCMELNISTAEGKLTKKNKKNEVSRHWVTGKRIFTNHWVYLDFKVGGNFWIGGHFLGRGALFGSRGTFWVEGHFLGRGALFGSGPLLSPSHPVQHQTHNPS